MLTGGFSISPLKASGVAAIVLPRATNGLVKPLAIDSKGSLGLTGPCDGRSTKPGGTSTTAPESAPWVGGMNPSDDSLVSGLGNDEL